jgi:hypothetical protein
MPVMRGFCTGPGAERAVDRAKNVAGTKNANFSTQGKYCLEEHAALRMQFVQTKLYDKKITSIKE